MCERQTELSAWLHCDSTLKSWCTRREAYLAEKGPPPPKVVPPEPEVTKLTEKGEIQYIGYTKE
jgi:hypothetical protein